MTGKMLIAALIAGIVAFTVTAVADGAEGPGANIVTPPIRGGDSYVYEHKFYDANGTS